MLRDLLKVLCLTVTFTASSVMAADRADEYPGFGRLTDNYEVQSRKQNYDEFEFPTSINNSQKVEGQKVLIEYGYKVAAVNASLLQFKRHFEGIAAKLGGEIVHTGRTHKYDNTVVFRFPKGGKTAWALVKTGGGDVYHYTVVIVETSATWNGAAAAVAPAPAATPTPPPTPAPTPKPAAVEAVAVPMPDLPWNGGDWVEVRFGGCDVLDVRRSKMAVPDPDFCDARMNGKVAICNADHGGCFYKNVTPKQCKDGSRPGRMFVCTPK